jgi:ribose-phosphate pyrophosphokinase
MISAFKRNSAKTVTAVIPYFGYCRSDRRFASGTTIAASDIAHILEGLGLDRIITLDIHAK